jgi:hypothetical protein
MAEDALYDNSNQQEEQEFSASPVQPPISSDSPQQHNIPLENTSYKYHAGRLVLSLSKEQLQVYEDVVFSIITKNNGKLRFIDILDLVGGPAQKNVLYKTLASLARQGRIERIRGIGKKRIEFYYYDSKKIKRPPASASVSFVSS